MLSLLVELQRDQTIQLLHMCMEYHGDSISIGPESKSSYELRSAVSLGSGFLTPGQLTLLPLFLLHPPLFSPIFSLSPSHLFSLLQIYLRHPETLSNNWWLHVPPYIPENPVLPLLISKYWKTAMILDCEGIDTLTFLSSFSHSLSNCKAWHSSPWKKFHGNIVTND